MEEKITGQFAISDLPESIITHKLKNFAIASVDEKPTIIAFEYPFSFEGVIFTVCKGGRASVKIEFEEYEVEPNTILTIFPNQLVEHINASENLVLEALAFNFEFLSDMGGSSTFGFFKNIAENPVIKVSDNDLDNLLYYFEFIKKNFEKAKPDFLNLIVKGLLYSLLSEIASVYMEKPVVQKKKIGSRGEEIVEHFLKLLKENYKTERMASFYADKLFITPKYLSYILKKVTGRSINLWIEGATVARAKMLLKTTNLTAMQISEEMNFPNPSYFGHFFKKCTGMTPKEYRDA